MDLNDIWQENKRFILGVLAALILFFVTRSVIGSIYDPAPPLADIRKSASAVAKDLYGSAALGQVRQQSEQLGTRVDALRKALEFKPQGGFLLAGQAGSPESQYFTQTDLVRKTWRERADRSNVDVPAAARETGLPRASPTEREEIQRVLTGLNLVDEAMRRLFAAADKVRETRPEDVALASLDRIEIRPATRLNRAPSREPTAEDRIEEVRVLLQFRALSPTIIGFLEACRDEKRPLLIDGIKMTAGSPGDPLTVTLELVALSVVKE